MTTLVEDPKAARRAQQAEWARNKRAAVKAAAEAAKNAEITEWAKAAVTAAAAGEPLPYAPGTPEVEAPVVEETPASIGTVEETPAAVETPATPGLITDHAWTVDSSVSRRDRGWCGFHGASGRCGRGKKRHAA